MSFVDETFAKARARGGFRRVQLQHHQATHSTWVCFPDAKRAVNLDTIERDPEMAAFLALQQIFAGEDRLAAMAARDVDRDGSCAE